MEMGTGRNAGIGGDCYFFVPLYFLAFFDKNIIQMFIIRPAPIMFEDNGDAITAVAGRIHGAAVGGENWSAFGQDKIHAVVADTAKFFINILGFFVFTFFAEKLGDRVGTVKRHPE